MTRKPAFTACGAVMCLLAAIFVSVALMPVWLLALSL
jgi:hypothetical protein